MGKLRAKLRDGRTHDECKEVHRDIMALKNDFVRALSKREEDFNTWNDSKKEQRLLRTILKLLKSNFLEVRFDDEEWLNWIDAASGNLIRTLTFDDLVTIYLYDPWSTSRITRSMHCGNINCEKIPHLYEPVIRQAYCSTECQKKHWKTQRVVTNAYQQAMQKEMLYDKNNIVLHIKEFQLSSISILNI